MFVAVAPMLVIAAQVQQQTLLVPKNVKGKVGFEFEGTSVTSVQKDSAAEAAGMKVGMVIVRFADVPIRSMQDLIDVEVPRGREGCFPVVVGPLQELWYIPKQHRVMIGTPADTALLENHRQSAALETVAEDKFMIAAQKLSNLGNEITELNTKIRTTSQKKDMASLCQLEDEKERVVGMHKEALAEATSVLSQVNRTIGSQMQLLSEVEERAKILAQERANMQIINHGNVLDWGRTQCAVLPHGVTMIYGQVDPATARPANEKDSDFFASVGGWHAGSETNNENADGNTSSMGYSHSLSFFVIRSKVTFKNVLHVHRVVFDRLQVIMAWDRMFPEDPFGATAQSPLQLLQIAKAPDSGKNAMPLITGAKYMAQFRGVIKSEDQPHLDGLRQTIHSMIRKIGGTVGQALVKFDGLLGYFSSFGRGLSGFWNSKDQQPADALVGWWSTAVVDRAYDSEGPVHYSGSASAYGVIPDWKTAQPQDFFNKQQVVKEEGFVDCVAVGQMKQECTTLEVTGPSIHSLLEAFSKFKTSVQHVDDSKEGGLQGAPYKFQVTYYTKKAIAENILNNFYPELMASEEL